MSDTAEKFARGLSLLERAQGPNAKPIAALIGAADMASGRLNAVYGYYVSAHLEVLAHSAQRALESANEEAWALLRAGLQDIESSSAMAESIWTASFANALQREIEVRELADPALAVLVPLHLDAIRIAASGVAYEAELASLHANLHNACAKLRGHSP